MTRGWIGSIADRAVVGWGTVVSGVVLIAVSWLGASGRAEVDEQLPWLTLGVAGLIVVVVGGALLALRHVRADSGALHRLEQDVERLHAAAVRDTDTVASATGLPADEVLVAPDAETFHRAGCRLVQDKPDVMAWPLADARGDGLEPCPLCEPAG